MIAEHADVVAHHVHEFAFHIAFEEFEIERALHSVAGIHQQHVFVGFAHAVDYGFALQRAAAAPFVGVYLRVGVVGAENGDFLGAGHAGAQCQY